MKRIVVLFILFLSVAAKADTLEGFLDIRFGSSLDSVKQLMMEKPGCVFDVAHSSSEQLTFNGFLFGERKTTSITFRFFANKFYTVSVSMQAEAKGETVHLYKAVIKDIDSLYNTQPITTETYIYPYEKGDGSTEEAIRLGKATFTSAWTFDNPKDPLMHNHIIIDILKSETIVITYDDGVLFAEKEAIQDASGKSSTDY